MIGDAGGWLVLVLVVLVGAALLWRRHETRQLEAARDRLVRAARGGHLRSVVVGDGCRPIRLRVTRPADAGWLIQPAGGLAAIQSIVPGLVVTADPATVTVTVTR